MKLFQCFILHVTTVSSYMWNKTLRLFQNYFKIITYNIKETIHWWEFVYTVLLMYYVKGHFDVIRSQEMKQESASLICADVPLQRK